MAEKLSGANFVIIIGSGILIFILLFIFVKRQIVRFALRSRRGPHIPVGHDSKKHFRREIERRIEAIPKIVYEPKLINENKPATSNDVNISLLCRQKAVDMVKIIDEEVKKQDKRLCRHPSDSLRAYLLNIVSSGLTKPGQRMVHEFCDLYEHARYDPTEFGEEDYQAYTKLFLKLFDS